MRNTPAIRFANVSKTFGKGKKRVEAVKNLELDIATGQVYGFLGPNGAGKTTTIRMVMDLIRPTAGAVYVFGHDVQRDHEVLHRVGALVEGGTFYNFLTGRKNLEVLARTSDAYHPARIEELLDQVFLTEAADRRVGNYSTGMKQRLGLAAALLTDPDLVLLDEPTNGLDPSGIQAMRYFIRDLAEKHSKTVFLSSHMLGEVEQVCDRVAIIHHGQIVREGTVQDLLRSEMNLLVRAEPGDKAAAILSAHWPVSANNGVLTVKTTMDDAPALVRHLVAAEVDVFEVTTHRQTLEEYFLHVIEGQHA